jgi:hypothetical protein
LVGNPDRQYPRIPRQLFEQIEAVEPSRDGQLEYRPCRVWLADGSVHDRVYVQEALAWIRMWGVWPDEDPGKNEIAIEHVVEIATSPVRLPAALATKMYDAGETGMGYCLFTVVLDDGTRLACGTGNAVDFVGLPEDAYGRVVDLVPHERDGDEVAVQPDLGLHAWCLYSMPPE